MYLKNLAVKNIGPIEELSIELPFKENGEPKPIIFVGENGSGKTILQSQIIDSFYEIGSSLFDDIGIQAGLKRNYYKISGSVNLQVGKDKGFSILKFIDSNNKTLEYFDKIGAVKKEDFTAYIQDFKLTPDEKNDNQKVTTNINESEKEKLQNEWIQGVHFYQPAYRYEEPFWKNEPFLDHARFEDQRRFSGQLGKELEIISSAKDSKSFLLNLVLDFASNPKNVIDQTTWKNINNILRQIKKRNDIRFGIGPRGRYRVSIVEHNQDGSVKGQYLSSIDNLSLGESILLNLFINIIRHGDNPPKTTEQIQGIVAIDEVDVHLHTDLQNSVLPELIKLFPKIQFIITTHSPLFLLGMKKTFGEDGFEVRSMPKGEIITTERFSEFENAYIVLRETEKFEDEVKIKVIANSKPIVYVEGPTDVLYIKKAYELYEKSYDFEIEIIGEETGSGTKNSNNKALSNAQKLLSVNCNLLKQKVILLNDSEESIKEEEYKDILFVRKIPLFNENPLKKGIENLFEKKLIDKAKNANANCFQYQMVGEEIKNFQIVKGKKQNICKWICDNGTKEDFKNFEKIFETVEKIISTKQDNEN
jgi:predicted ATPase